VAAVLLVDVAVPGGWGDAAWVVLVAGLLLGLPHGAVDHLVPATRLRWPLSRVAVFAAGYAALAAVAWLAFRTWPGPAVLVFVAVSAWHFGTGETAFADLRAGRPVRRRVTAAFVVGSVMTAPAAGPWDGRDRHGRRSRRPRLRRDAAGRRADRGAHARAAGHGAAGRGAGARRHLLEAAELAGLVVLVLVVPPLAAFGVYFGCWHSVRHVARVVAHDPGSR
jgi:hypothetical protein